MRFLILAARGGSWLLATAITVVSFVPVWARPDTALPHRFEHFAAFFVIGLAFGLGYAHRPVRTAIGLVLWSGLIEIAQLFVPWRHSRFSDFVVDALAVCIGVVIASIAVRLFEARLAKVTLANLSSGADLI